MIEGERRMQKLMLIVEPGCLTLSLFQLSLPFVQLPVLSIQEEKAER